MKIRRLTGILLLVASAAGLIFCGVTAFQDRRYNLISVILVLLACVPFYYAYEKKDGNIRRMVILAVMTAIAVVGRFVFVVLPGFKPVTAVVIIAGMYMGPEAGFLTGSLAAIISNMFFGQGPWTPFQMLAWGLPGMIAGLPGIRKALKSKSVLVIYGVVTGFMYSAIMDIWTVLSMDGTFNWIRYGAALFTAIPVTIEYMAANVVFLMLGIGPIGTKLERIRLKHGIFDE